MIVPDTIEPVIGWKALIILPGGMLVSPQQKMPWPAKQRAEASCCERTYRWVARKGTQPQPEQQENTEVGFSFSNISPTTPTYYLFNEDMPRPATLLPDGMHWNFEAHPHDPASRNDCGCGIYMVDDPDKCGGYLDNNTVLVQVAGWGNVIQGDRGARVQYAYPQLIVSPPQLFGRAEHAAERYGIPLVATNLTRNDTNTAAQQASDVLAQHNQTRRDPSLFTFWSLGAVIVGVLSAIGWAATWGKPQSQTCFKMMLTSIATLGVMLVLDLLVCICQERSRKT